MLVCAATGAQADVSEPLLSDLVWLHKDADPIIALTMAPPEPNASNDRFAETNEYELGRLAFRSPTTLGGLAARMNMSCQTCHTNGGRNREFFAATLSTEPGTFDPTNALFNKKTDNDLFDPIEIPELFGVANNAPYPSDDRFETLSAMTRHVIVDEFAGAEPPKPVFDAIIFYMRQLKRPSSKAAITKWGLCEDLRELDRYGVVFENALEANDAPTSDFVLHAIRRHLASIHERYAETPVAQEELAKAGVALVAVRKLIEDEDYGKASTTFGRIIGEMDRDLLSRAEANSYYEPSVLMNALSMNTPHRRD